ncbi:NAD(P)/FAD-dependent oxidoreductase [Alkalihalobacillus sp. CinArs1]|uniref:NAD(P)/FAD-dependent oxidoreductase n=1 Tax=Alkalihalobacillus sp. CinArs1 TaxID=2995314 RepID=UPI0022DE4DE9|nr:FAD-dependent oxidoreductase [Alkalihalobacillus sp. CinArs1]
MDLHNGKPFWPTLQQHKTLFPKLKSSISCDVLIIGGGIAGTIMARMLSDYQLKTVLLEKDEIGSGSTAANTGLLQFSNDEFLVDLIDSIGEEKAVYFYKLCLKALDELDKYHSYLPSPADFNRVDSLYYASSDRHAKKLKNEFEALQKHGFAADFLDQRAIESLYSFRAPCGIYTKNEVEVNPYKFAHALAAHSHDLGVDLYEHTEVLSHRFTDNELYFETEYGQVKAKHVIYATGYATQEFAKTKGALLERTYTIATEPIESFDGWHNRSLIWETNRPYYYLRTTADRRILIGGLDTSFNKEDMLETTSTKLLDKLHSMFPNIQTSIANEWSSVFASSKDGLPFIGQHPKYKGVYFMLGYGGNGTVYNMVAADILKDLILYNYHPAMMITSLKR